MKFFVTGVGGQLGHDVMNELLKRGHEGVGSDIQENYSGVADGSAVMKPKNMVIIMQPMRAAISAGTISRKKSIVRLDIRRKSCR